VKSPDRGPAGKQGEVSDPLMLDAAFAVCGTGRREQTLRQGCSGGGDGWGEGVSAQVYSLTDQSGAGGTTL